MYQLEMIDLQKARAKAQREKVADLYVRLRDLTRLTHNTSAAKDSFGGGSVFYKSLGSLPFFTVLLGFVLVTVLIFQEP